METTVLKATARKKTGSTASALHRREGKTPAVLYGHKEESVSLLVGADELVTAVRHGVRMVDLKISRKTERAIIREIQYDHLGEEILHVDFIRVSMTEKVPVAVDVVLHGHPVGVHEGGHLDQTIHQITVECLPKDIPEKIDLNVAELGLGQAVSVADLQLPEGVTCALDPEVKIAIVHPPRAAAAAEVEAGEEGEEGEAEPEVLTQRKSKDGEEEQASEKK